MGKRKTRNICVVGVVYYERLKKRILMKRTNKLVEQWTAVSHQNRRVTRSIVRKFRNLLIRNYKLFHQKQGSLFRLKLTLAKISIEHDL